MLLIIENYALNLLGELPTEKAATMKMITARVWGGGDDWMETVRETMGWDTSIDETIRQNWTGYQRAAEQQGVTGSAEEFAMMFADAVADSGSGGDST